MFYEVLLKSHIRVPPSLFGIDTKESVLRSINERFENYISKDIGVVVGVSEVVEIGEGIIIAGDGAAYYDTTFKILAYKPELQEVVVCKVNVISDFGAFVDIGPLDGMIHISQTMDDFVSFSKANVLTGKESKRSLKIGDVCKARIIAVSYKDIANPKIGLTMRQPWLGKEEWIKDAKKERKDVKEVKEKK